MLAAAYKEGYSIERLYELTKIDKWFLNRMKCIMDYALMLKRYREIAEVTVMFSIVNLFKYKIIVHFILYMLSIGMDQEDPGNKMAIILFDYFDLTEFFPLVSYMYY